MARKRRGSRVIARALSRISGMEAIDPALDLGNGLTVANFQTVIDAGATALDAYNQRLADTDSGLNNVQLSEKKIRDLSERMLEGVATKFGHDSNEYEMAGGTRKSERKKPVRKPTTP